MNQYFKIGRLAATFGVEGQMVLQHSLGKKNGLKNLDTIFIEETEDSFLPYFISSLKIKNENEILVSFEGISSKEAARFLLKKEVWLNEPDFKRFVKNTAVISFLGFTIISNQKELGEVIEVIEQPHQLLCTILMDKKEIFIPIHEDSLEKVDQKNRKLFVNLPDGLLEIYKNE